MNTKTDEENGGALGMVKLMISKILALFKRRILEECLLSRFFSPTFSLGGSRPRENEEEKI